MTNDILKSLINLGLVSYYHKQSHQYFVAESPDKLLNAVDEKKKQLEETKNQLQKGLPQLQSLYEKQGGRPVVKVYERLKGIRTILQDVLDRVGSLRHKEYYVYSSATVRKMCICPCQILANKESNEG